MRCRYCKDGIAVDNWYYAIYPETRFQREDPDKPKPIGLYTYACRACAQAHNREGQTE